MKRDPLRDVLIPLVLLVPCLLVALALVPVAWALLSARRLVLRFEG